MDRYQVGNEHGHDHYADTKDDAFRRAAELAKRDGQPSWVYDRLAHRGKPQEWRVMGDGNAVVVSVRRE